jgi:hypothetical protein
VSLCYATTYGIFLNFSMASSQDVVVCAACLLQFPSGAKTISFKTLMLNKLQQEFEARCQVRKMC